MKIGELAEKSGVNRQTIRYYESLNLLENPKRTASGYRLYDETSIQQLGFIRRAKSIGFTLKDIRQLMVLSTTGTTNCREIASFAKDKLKVVRDRIAHLQSFEQSLDDLEILCKSSSSLVNCTFVDNLLSVKE